MAKLTAKDVRSLLRKRYADHQWFLAFEVRDATGFQKSSNSYADAIAMNTWPSKGFVIHGHEIKVSRSDWQKELDQPYKADPFLKLVDFWWLVAPAGVAHLSEIPPTWGFLRAEANRIVTARDAPRLSQGPEALPREFVSSIVRKRASEDLDFVEAIEAARKSAREEGKRQAEYAQHRDESEGPEAIRWRQDLAKRIGEDEFSLMLNGPEVVARRLQASFRLVKRLEQTYAVSAIERATEGVQKALEDFKTEIGEIAPDG